MPKTVRPSCTAVRTTARRAAFMPGASPPLVSTPIRCMGLNVRPVAGGARSRPAAAPDGAGGNYRPSAARAAPWHDAWNMRIVALKEANPGENRVPVTPQTVEKLVRLGASVALE